MYMKLWVKVLYQMKVYSIRNFNSIWQIFSKNTKWNLRSNVSLVFENLNFESLKDKIINNIVTGVYPIKPTEKYDSKCNVIS